MKKRFALLPLLLLLGCDSAPSTAHQFLCVAPQSPPVLFAFDTKDKSIWIDGLLFQNQNWIERTAISETQVVLIWNQEHFLMDTKTGRSYKTPLLYDYRFNRARQLLSFAHYTEGAPEAVSAVAALRERELQYTCAPEDVFSLLERQIDYTLKPFLE